MTATVDEEAVKRRVLDRTMIEARSKFADLPPDELEAMLAEAVTAARKPSSAEPG